MGRFAPGRASASLGDGLGPYPEVVLDTAGGVELCDVARGECVEAELAPLRTQGSVVATARDRTPWSLSVSGTIDAGGVSLFAVITYEHAITRTLPGSRPSIGDELTLAVLGSDGAAIDTQRFRFTSIGLPAEGASCEVGCSFGVEQR